MIPSEEKIKEWTDRIKKSAQYRLEKHAKLLTKKQIAAVKKFLKKEIKRGW